MPLSSLSIITALYRVQRGLPHSEVRSLQKTALTGKPSKRDSLACDVKCRDGCDVQTGQLIPRQWMKKWSCGEQPIAAAEVY